jgi:hypothetical protein
LSNLLIQLNSNSPNYALEIKNYQNSEGNQVKLQNPIFIFTNISSSKLQIPLKFQKTIFNKFEHFEPLEDCFLGDQSTEGCRDPSKTPPKDGEENFILCCLESRRGQGNHCLRYNYTEKYDSYEMSPFNVIHNVKVSVSVKGRLEIFELTNFQPKKTIQNFGNFKMTINYQQNRPNDYKWRFNIFRDFQTDSWFFIEKFLVDFSKLTRTAREFKAFSSCSDPIHHQTRTHDVESFVLDQFFSFKNNTLDWLFQKDGNHVNVVNHEGEFFIEMEVDPDLIILDFLLENVE